MKALQNFAEAEVLFIDADCLGKNILRPIQGLINRMPFMRIIIWSSIKGQQMVERIFEMGIYGFLFKGVDPAIMIETINKVFNGKRVLPEKFEKNKKAIRDNSLCRMDKHLSVVKYRF